jgi:hypothetical protein
MQVALVVAVKAALMKAVKARWIDRGPTCRMQCNTRHATGGPESPYTPTEYAGHAYVRTLEKVVPERFGI